MKMKISKILLIAVSIVPLAWFLPDFYDVLFKDSVRPPYVVYSAVSQDFYFFRSGKKGLTDREGNRYTEQQSDSLLPLFYYRQLYSQGKMPDTVRGVEIRPKMFKVSNYTVRLKSKDLDGPQIPLQPLFESVLRRGKLSFPHDVFRINKRMEFLDCASNQVNEKKSEAFTRALNEAGFQYPAARIYGNPSARKAYDWGYFVIDSSEKLFHVRMRNGLPLVKAVKLPEGVKKVARVQVTEQSSRRYYALVLSEAGNVYYLRSKSYQWVQFPIPPIDVYHENISISGNPLYQTIRVVGKGRVKAYAVTKDFKLENEYSEELPVWENSGKGRVKQYLFPFELSAFRAGSTFVNFHLKNFSWQAVFVNMLFSLLIVFWGRKRKQPANKLMLSFAVCLVAGVYGFVGAAVFQD